MSGTHRAPLALAAHCHPLSPSPEAGQSQALQGLGEGEGRRERGGVEVWMTNDEEAVRGHVHYTS